MAAAILLGCGPSKAWNGQWYLNEEKSFNPAPTFVISVTPSQMYRLDAGTLVYNFACDGKKYPTIANRSVSCTQSEPSTIDSISTINDSVIDTKHWKLSSDGASLSITTTPVDTSSTTAKSTVNIFTRTDRSTGFTGAWRNIRPFGDRRRILSLTLRGDTLHFAHQETGLYADIRLDGSDALVHGESIPLGASISLKPRGSHEFLAEQKVQGRIVNIGTLRLSDDGQTLTEEDSPPGSNQKSKLVYEKLP
jgi:hypothetical protein